MRILMVSDYTVQDGIVGGATRVFEAYRDGLEKRGHLITVLSARDALPARKRAGERSLPFLQFLNQIRKACHGKDLLLCHLPLSTFLTVLARGPSPPMVYIFHSPWHMEFQTRHSLPCREKPLPEGSAALPGLRKLLRDMGGWGRKMLERVAVRNATMVITLSQYMRRELLFTHQIPEKKVTILPGGVDLLKFHPGDQKSARKALSLPPSPFIIFTARDFIPRTGVDLLPEVAEGMVRPQEAEGPAEEGRLLFVVAGDGPLKEKITREVRERGLSPYFLFPGFLSDSVLPLYYQAANLFLLPTRELEGFGLVILESWASGTPVIGTPVGAIPELLSQLHPSSLLPSLQPSEIASHLLSMVQRPPLIRELAQASLAAVQNYSWEKRVQELEERLERICHASAPSHYASK